MDFHLEDINLIKSPLIVPSPSQQYRWEPSPRRVRAMFGGETIADSTHVMLLLEVAHLPVYYFPWANVQGHLLERTDYTTESPLKGTASYWTVRVGDRVAENAAWSYETPLPDGPDLSGYVALYWTEMDTWYEEDERAFAHARDPYKLVDIRQSTRHVRIELEGETLAETHRPKLLFETGMPVRYYIPREDVRMNLLEPGETHSQCAYKGEASYYSARIGERFLGNVAWYYPEPLALVAPIANLIAFFQERVDAVFVDDEQVERPQTQWARERQ
jgi:uncharacterized protein (DUF427 family)